MLEKKTVRYTRNGIVEMDKSSGKTKQLTVSAVGKAGKYGAYSLLRGTNEAIESGSPEAGDSVANEAARRSYAAVRQSLSYGAKPLRYAASKTYTQLKRQAAAANAAKTSHSAAASGRRTYHVVSSPSGKTASPCTSLQKRSAVQHQRSTSIPKYNSVQPVKSSAAGAEQGRRTAYSTSRRSEAVSSPSRGNNFRYQPYTRQTTSVSTVSHSRDRIRTVAERKQGAVSKSFRAKYSPTSVAAKTTRRTIQRKGQQTAKKAAASAARQAVRQTVKAVSRTAIRAATAFIPGVSAVRIGLVVLCILLLMGFCLIGSCTGGGAGVLSGSLEEIQTITTDSSVVKAACDKLDTAFRKKVKSAGKGRTIVGLDTMQTDADGLAVLLLMKGYNITQSSSELTAKLTEYYEIINTYTVTEKKVKVSCKTVLECIDAFGLSDEEKAAFEEILQFVGVSTSDGSTDFANEYSDLVTKYAKKYGVEPAYIYATMEAESNFQPNLTSPVGASGLMQIMPITFTYIKVLLLADGEKEDGYTYADIFDPEVNIKYGTRYLKYLKDTFSGATVKTRAAAYNAGPGSVQGWLSNTAYSSDGINLTYSAIPYAETKAYVEKIGTYYDKYSNWGKGSSKGQFVWPAPGTTVITSGVGQRWGKSHNGIDISSGDAYGNSIVAADGGTVITAVHSGWGGGYGLHVMIDHGNGYVTVYGHASRILVNTGDKVYQGQKIAEIGSTGDSTGPHLHFEIRKDGVIVDPEEYVTPS